MQQWFEKMIQRRNQRFQLDAEIKGGMVRSFVFNQAIAMLRGCILLLAARNPKRMMKGRGVRFSYLSNIRWGYYLKLGEYVHFSGLGRLGITLGNNVSIGDYSRVIVATTFQQIGEGIHIGNNVGIGEFAYLGGAGGLTIGDDCIVGQYFSCHPENHVYNDIKLPIRLQGVTRKGISIGSNCWIGSKVTILDGVTIGSGCVVAAGAVVTKSFPSNMIIGGVPATIIRKRTHTTNCLHLTKENEQLYENDFDYSIRR